MKYLCYFSLELLQPEVLHLTEDRIAGLSYQLSQSRHGNYHMAFPHQGSGPGEPAHYTESKSRPFLPHYCHTKILGNGRSVLHTDNDSLGQHRTQLAGLLS